MKEVEEEVDDDAASTLANSWPFPRSKRGERGVLMPVVGVEENVMMMLLVVSVLVMMMLLVMLFVFVKLFVVFESSEDIVVALTVVVATVVVVVVVVTQYCCCWFGSCCCWSAVVDVGVVGVAGLQHARGVSALCVCAREGKKKLPLFRYATNRTPSQVCFFSFTHTSTLWNTVNYKHDYRKTHAGHYYCVVYSMLKSIL